MSLFVGVVVNVSGIFKKAWSELIVFIFWMSGFVVLVVKTTSKVHVAPAVWYKFTVASVSLGMNLLWLLDRPTSAADLRKTVAGCAHGLDLEKFGDTDDDRKRLVFVGGSLIINMAAIFTAVAWTDDNHMFGGNDVAWWGALQPTVNTLICTDTVLRFVAYQGKDLTKTRVMQTRWGSYVHALDHPEVFTLWMAEFLSDLSIAAQWLGVTSFASYIVVVWVMPITYTWLFLGYNPMNDDDDTHWVHEASNALRFEAYHRVRSRLSLIVLFALIGEPYISPNPERPETALGFCIAAYAFSLTTVAHFLFTLKYGQHATALDDGRGEIGGEIRE